MLFLTWSNEVFSGTRYDDPPSAYHAPAIASASITDVEIATPMLSVTQNDGTLRLQASAVVGGSRTTLNERIIDALGPMLSDETGSFAAASYALLSEQSRPIDDVPTLRNSIPF